MAAALIVAVFLGLIPAFIAQSKGRNFVLWWLYGWAIFIVAFPHALLMQATAEASDQQKLDEGGRRCPYCAEIVKSAANVCRYCHREIGLRTYE